MDQRLDRIRFILYTALLVILFFYVIIVARAILIPVSLAFLFATLIYPVYELFIRLKFPKPLAVLASILLFIGIIAFAFMLFIHQMQELVTDFPLMKQKALEYLQLLKQSLEDNWGIDSARLHFILTERIRFLFDTGSDFLRNVVNATAGTIFKLILIPVLMFYMLMIRDRFRESVVMLLKEERREQTERIMTQISNVIQRYITGVFSVILILCVLNSAGLYIVGVKYALIFGVISALFNLIPYFGNWIGAIFPLTYAFLTGDSPALFISVLILYAIIQFIEHNILTPNITGSYVRINPLVIIISIIIGGLVWKVAGMLVVVPFIATLKIIFENVDHLKPFAHLIGSDEIKHPIIIKKILEKFRFSKKS